MSRNYLLFALVAVLIAVGSLAAGHFMHGATPGKQDAPASAFKTFSLVDQIGQPVTEATYRGRWLLVFFGFLRCPDICPTSMSYAGDLLKNLGPDAEKMQIAFVTIDPERDTAPALKDYLANFDPRLVGLTGTPAQIAAIAEAFGVYYAKRKIDGQDDYTMDHSSAFYLVDPEGRLLRAFSLQRGADQMTTDIHSAMNAASQKE